jgi:hypothetical protein
MLRLLIWSEKSVIYSSKTKVLKPTQVTVYSHEKNSPFEESLSTDHESDIPMIECGVVTPSFSHKKFTVWAETCKPENFKDAKFLYFDESKSSFICQQNILFNLSSKLSSDFIPTVDFWYQHCSKSDKSSGNLNVWLNSLKYDYFDPTSTRSDLLDCLTGLPSNEGTQGARIQIYYYVSISIKEIVFTLSESKKIAFQPAIENFLIFSAKTKGCKTIIDEDIKRNPLFSDILNTFTANMYKIIQLN